MGRRQNSAPMSFFSFQDIITATTGILILLALVLALSVIDQGAQSDVEIPNATNEQVANRAGLISEVESLKKLSEEIATETASLASATPDELKGKLAETNEAISRLKQTIKDAQSELYSQQQQLEELQNSSTDKAMKTASEKLERSIKETNLKLKDLKSDNRVVYNFRETTREPWVVQISDAKILAARVGRQEKPRSFNLAADFNQFATSVPDAQQYFVLVVRPDGIENLDSIKAFLFRKRFDVGVELIGESVTVVDPEKGLGF
jgi:hypothetical protein